MSSLSFCSASVRSNAYRRFIVIEMIAKLIMDWISKLIHKSKTDRDGGGDGASEVVYSRSDFEFGMHDVRYLHAGDAQTGEFYLSLALIPFFSHIFSLRFVALASVCLGIVLLFPRADPHWRSFRLVVDKNGKVLSLI